MPRHLKPFAGPVGGGGLRSSTGSGKTSKKLTPKERAEIHRINRDRGEFNRLMNKSRAKTLSTSEGTRLNKLRTPTNIERMLNKEDLIRGFRTKP